MLLPKTGIIANATDQEFQSYMKAYIKTHFADTLGEDASLLDLPNGLDLVQEQVNDRLAKSGVKPEKKQTAA